jgi:hypothetical protein
VIRKTNSFEIELPDNVGISLIFNVAIWILIIEMTQKNWMIRKKFSGEEQMPTIGENFRTEIERKTRRKMYPEYLVKWKDHPVEDSCWVNELDILKHGRILREIMDNIP